ncbi:uncharacterized protein N7459_005473 [Penicillium hispanicum]|uniref:uncharacterized protein n=1 Tax=Penicillium hispanicum TaxID=1080232 RepID=UPI002541E7EC|nr:uncharacterized protein N7459_005473 [Penicillium hispanicum]KAJ5579488.1 hypothetical protein N7459_005473 [Penicillium hispanicum]
MTEPASSSLERPASALVPARPPSPNAHEALELHEIQTREDRELDYSDPSASSGEEYRMTSRRTTPRLPNQEQKGAWRKICRFWTHNVTLTVPQRSNRDYFALERTFLAYIRTSVVIAMQGVLIAQLFRLQRSPASEDRLKFYQVGIPLSVTCHCVAVIVAAIGAYRFWRQQSAFLRGKVHAGGWELNFVGIFLFAIILVTLIISVAIIVEIDTGPVMLLHRIIR